MAQFSDSAERVIDRIGCNLGREASSGDDLIALLLLAVERRRARMRCDGRLVVGEPGQNRDAGR